MSILGLEYGDNPQDCGVLEDSHLTPSQLHSNAVLDLRLQQAHDYNDMVNEKNRKKIQAWEEHKKVNPDDLWMGVPDIDMSCPRIVMGIRYV